MKVNWLLRGAMPPLPYMSLICDEPTFHKELKRLNIKEYVSPLKTKTANATVHHLTNKKGEDTLIVFIPKKDILEKSLPVLCGLLVHEAMHIWRKYRKRLGEDNPSSEFEAYCVQRISQNLISEALRIRKVK